MNVGLPYLLLLKGTITAFVSLVSLPANPGIAGEPLSRVDQPAAQRSGGHHPELAPPRRALRRQRRLLRSRPAGAVAGWRATITPCLSSRCLTGPVI